MDLVGEGSIEQQVQSGGKLAQTGTPATRSPCYRIEMSRLAKLKAMLQARTDPDGTPLPGFAENVEEIRKEIARLTPTQPD